MPVRGVTIREKRILLVAAAIALLMLFSRGLPAVTGLYQERAGEIERLRDEIAREERLIEESDQWRERRRRIEQRREELAGQVFRQTAPPVVSAEIQRLVRQYANQSDVSINGARLAESMRGEGWLLVEQTLSFSMDEQSNTLDFLARLQQSSPWLGVSSLSLRRTRDQYAGDITVVGFARSEDEEMEEVASP